MHEECLSQHDWLITADWKSTLRSQSDVAAPNRLKQTCNVGPGYILHTSGAHQIRATIQNIPRWRLFQKSPESYSFPHKDQQQIRHYQGQLLDCTLCMPSFSAKVYLGSMINVARVSLPGLLETTKPGLEGLSSMHGRKPSHFIMRNATSSVSGCQKIAKPCKTS